ncbi:nucleotidyltransferase domain-containing protein [Nakamurella multipartita]|uniref:Nucleotidyltransferase family protein n=1 Tax=Nakamurella multipartita (strain ATCC 700099 / DSM 44233 / CIP 104796 / JCM 9543 / NBRC 105858 / Y-104) TaxID=479431 RepID=C8X6N8_NAKMY|nr:nucleotidyltransferase family protein [Nakamurella multipartita]ACV80786.1 hypothetical protein Namu_4505 [Nakamurella multipartita DSM 44233]
MAVRRRRASSRNPSVTRALLSACRATWPPSGLSATEIDEFVDAARLHRIAPLAYVATRGLDDVVAGRVREDRDRALATTFKATLTLGSIRQALDGLPWLTFKGLVLSMNHHPVPGLRTFTDIDVLIHPRALRDACERLRAAGWRLLDYDDMLSRDRPPGEMHWLSPHGLQLDLHWSMINSAVRRDLFDIQTDGLLSRRVTATVGLTSVPTLNPEDTVVHTCLHAALDGSARLLQLVDTDSVARSVTNWETVIERAHQWRAQAQVWLVLHRAQANLGTPLPEGLSDSLGISAPLRGMFSAVDRVAPVAQVRHVHDLSRFGARAVRASFRATLSVAVQHAALGVADRVRRDAQVDHGRVPASAATYDRFLRTVEASSQR